MLGNTILQYSLLLRLFAKKHYGKHIFGCNLLTVNIIVCLIPHCHGIHKQVYKHKYKYLYNIKDVEIFIL